MMHDAQKPDNFDARVRAAISEGAKGRSELVEQLCQLSVEQLTAVSPDVLAMIGPEGLAALAVRRAEFAGLAPRPVPIAPRAVEPNDADSSSRRNTRQIPVAVWLGVCAVLAAMSFDQVGAMMMPQGAVAPLSLDAATWPRCMRLDHKTDGCVYLTGGNRLTLDRAAVLLGMDRQGLSDLNQHLGRYHDGALPVGSSVIILRDRSRLSGRSS